MKKSEKQLKEEKRELEIMEIVFDQDEHLGRSGANFEDWLLKLGKENLGKQIKEAKEVEKELTAGQKREIRLFEEAKSSGFKGSIQDWKKMKK